MFTKDTETLLRYPSGKEDTVYTIPDNVKIIGFLAFYFAKNIEKLVVPSALENIGELYNSFVMYTEETFNVEISDYKVHSNFCGFSVNDKNLHYCAVDGALFTKDMNILVNYPSGKQITEYIIDDRVGVSKFKSNSYGNNNEYSVSLKYGQSYIGKMLYGKSYLIYKDENGEIHTVYSDTNNIQL